MPLLTHHCFLAPFFVPAFTVLQLACLPSLLFYLFIHLLVYMFLVAMYISLFLFLSCVYNCFIRSVIYILVNLFKIIHLTPLFANLFDFPFFTLINSQSI